MKTEKKHIILMPRAGFGLANIEVMAVSKDEAVLKAKIEAERLPNECFSPYRNNLIANKLWDLFPDTFKQ
jgi:hypothetical protein